MIITPNLNIYQLLTTKLVGIVVAGWAAFNTRFDRLYVTHLKRLFDLTVSATVLVMVAPVIVVVALLVRIKLGSPILFKQQRPGLKGQPFSVFKFRSMTDARDADGNLLPDDIRLTPFGQFLRKWSLDELPQLLNVLRGDISLVGPRPLLMHYLDRYTPQQARRNEVHPGITGLAQVNGRNAISWEDKFAYDTHYVDNISFWTDFKILLLTAKKLVKPQDISQAGHATMTEFMGTQIVETVAVVDMDETVAARPASIPKNIIRLDKTVAARPVSIPANIISLKSIEETQEATDMREELIAMLSKDETQVAPQVKAEWIAALSIDSTASAISQELIDEIKAKSLAATLSTRQKPKQRDKTQLLSIVKIEA